MFTSGKAIIEYLNKNKIIEKNILLLETNFFEDPLHMKFLAALYEDISNQPATFGEFHLQLTHLNPIDIIPLAETLGCSVDDLPKTSAVLDEAFSLTLTFDFEMSCDNNGKISAAISENYSQLTHDIITEHYKLEQKTIRHGGNCCVIAKIPIAFSRGEQHSDTAETKSNINDKPVIVELKPKQAIRLNKKRKYKEDGKAQDFHFGCDVNELITIEGFIGDPICPILIARESTKALLEYQNTGACHGDIKPHNMMIIIDGDHSIRIVMIDIPTNTQPGAKVEYYTPGYDAPRFEAKQTHTLSKSNDNFSMGVSLGKSLIKDNESRRLFNEVKTYLRECDEDDHLPDKKKYKGVHLALTSSILARGSTVTADTVTELCSNIMVTQLLNMGDHQANMQVAYRHFDCLHRINLLRQYLKQAGENNLLQTFDHKLVSDFENYLSCFQNAYFTQSEFTLSFQAGLTENLQAVLPQRWLEHPDDYMKPRGLTRLFIKEKVGYLEKVVSEQKSSILIEALRGAKEDLENLLDTDTKSSAEKNQRAFIYLVGQHLMASDEKKRGRGHSRPVQHPQHLVNRPFSERLALLTCFAKAVNHEALVMLLQQLAKQADPNPTDKLFLSSARNTLEQAQVKNLATVLARPEQYLAMIINNPLIYIKYNYESVNNVSLQGRVRLLYHYAELIGDQQLPKILNRCTSTHFQALSSNEAHNARIMAFVLGNHARELTQFLKNPTLYFNYMRWLKAILQKIQNTIPQDAFNSAIRNQIQLNETLCFTRPAIIIEILVKVLKSTSQRTSVLRNTVFGRPFQADTTRVNALKCLISALGFNASTTIGEMNAFFNGLEHVAEKNFFNRLNHDMTVADLTTNDNKHVDLTRLFTETFYRRLIAAVEQTSLQVLFEHKDIKLMTEQTTHYAMRVMRL